MKKKIKKFNCERRIKEKKVLPKSTTKTKNKPERNSKRSKNLSGRKLVKNLKKYGEKRNKKR